MQSKSTNLIITVDIITLYCMYDTFNASNIKMTLETVA